MHTKSESDKIIETHPWDPFVPDGAETLIMGTFPPASKRWSMDFYYPNAINDFWRIMGLIFLDDKDAFWDADKKSFKLDQIKALLTEKGIAMNDTVHRAHRAKGNASDKFLEVVEPVNLAALMAQMPNLKQIATTGEKAASIIAELTGTLPPKMGEYVTTESGLKIWRMPSTSRAYPLKLEKKAEYYRRLFE